MLALAFGAAAQKNEPATGKLHVFSSVGLSWINKSYKPASGNSIQTTTGLELRLSPLSSLGAALSFDSYGYQKAGTSYDLDGTLKATALALFYRFKFSNGTWQPYLKAGGGTAWLTLPVVSTKQGITVIDKEVQNVGVALAEAGFQIRVVSRYSLLVAAEQKWMAKSSLADNTALRSTGIKIGLISSF